MTRMPSEAFRNPLAPDDFAWAERSANWLRSRPDERGLGRPPRQSHEPLVLTGRGMCLRVDHGALVVRNGFTHYPQRAEEHRFFRGDRHLSSRIIVVDGSGILLLSWLSERTCHSSVSCRGQRNLCAQLAKRVALHPVVEAQGNSSYCWATRRTRLIDRVGCGGWSIDGNPNNVQPCRFAIRFTTFASSIPANLKG
jgi:hypothetical protein